MRTSTSPEKGTPSDGVVEPKTMAALNAQFENEPQPLHLYRYP